MGPCAQAVPASVEASLLGEGRGALWGCCFLKIRVVSGTVCLLLSLTPVDVSSLSPVGFSGCNGGPVRVPGGEWWSGQKRGGSLCGGVAKQQLQAVPGGGAQIRCLGSVLESPAPSGQLFGQASCPSWESRFFGGGGDLFAGRAVGGGEDCSVAEEALWAQASQAWPSRHPVSSAAVGQQP